MAVDGTGSLVVLVIVLIAALTLQAQVDGKSQDNFKQDKENNVSRIIDHTTNNGKPETAGNTPWQVLMLTAVDLDAEEEFTCGGSILLPQWIMSAAHCIAKTRYDATLHPDGYNIIVKSVILIAGVTNRNKNEYGTNAQSNTYTNEEILAKGIDKHVFIHKDFNKGIINNNDIALFKLKKPLDVNDFVHPILLATSKDLIQGRMLTATGWGRMSFDDNEESPSDLRTVSGLILKSKEECATIFKDRYILSDTMICQDTPNKRTYKGDSGGPVTFKQGTSSVQIGIVSFGPPIAGIYRNVFTDVAKLRPWIHITMQYPLGEACPEDSDFFVPTGSRQCFTFLKDLVTWEQAENGCTEQGLRLAHPFDAVLLRRYIVERYGSLNYLWLGARRENDDGQMRWALSGEEITAEDIIWIKNDNPLWYTNQPRTGRPGCLLLLSTEKYWKESAKSPYWDCHCDYPTWAVCELVLS